MDTPNTDPNAGHGGSYVLDPETGARTLVERTAPAEDQPTAPAGAQE